MTAERTTEKRAGERDALSTELDMLMFGKGPHVLKLDVLFGHRPEVLESVKRARGRGLGTDTIAKVLARSGESVSGSAVKTWLAKNGVK